MLYISYLLFLFFNTKVASTEEKLKCSEFCVCDNFFNQIRASCNNRQIITIELNLPSEIENLDISNNHIRELNDKIFLQQHLTNLKTFNISHNMVHDIHLNAFDGLDKLEILDLSFNAIEYFSQNWFKNFENLQELILRGNKLRSINEQPLLNLKSLRFLDLSFCGISTLKAQTLKLIPNLQYLDISDNFLNIIDKNLPQTLPKLLTISLYGINALCSKENQIIFMEFFFIHEIKINHNCESELMMKTSSSYSTNRPKIEKFQKIIMISKNNEKSATKVEETQKETFICNYTNNINNNNNNTEFPALSSPNLLMEIILLSPVIVLSITFIYGVLVGMAIISAVNLCRISRKKKSTQQINNIPKKKNIQTYSQSVPNLFSRRIRERRSNSRILDYYSMKKGKNSHNDDDEQILENLVLSEINLAESTPMASRKFSTLKV